MSNPAQQKRGKAIVKIIAFLLIAKLVDSFFPSFFWNFLPDFALLRGPAKGSCLAVLVLLLLSFFFLRSEGKTLADIGIQWRRRRLLQWSPDWYWAWR
jgi:hypothetical protein